MFALLFPFRYIFSSSSWSWIVGIALVLLLLTLGAICWKMPVGEVLHGMRRLLGSLCMAPIVQLRKSIRFFQEYSWETFRSLFHSEQFLSITVSHIMHLILLVVFTLLMFSGFVTATYTLLPESIRENRDSTMSQAAWDSLSQFNLVDMASWSYKDLGRAESNMESQIEALEERQNTASGTLAQLDREWAEKGAATLKERQEKSLEETKKAAQVYERALAAFGNTINGEYREGVLEFIKKAAKNNIEEGRRSEIQSASEAMMYYYSFGIPEESYMPVLKNYAALRRAQNKEVTEEEVRQELQPTWKSTRDIVDGCEMRLASKRAFLEPIHEQRAWHGFTALTALLSFVVMAMVWVLVAGIFRESMVLMLVMANNLHQLKLATVEKKKAQAVVPTLPEEV